MPGEKKLIILFHESVTDCLIKDAVDIGFLMLAMWFSHDKGAFWMTVSLGLFILLLFSKTRFSNNPSIKTFHSLEELEDYVNKQKENAQ